MPLPASWALYESLSVLVGHAELVNENEAPEPEVEPPNAIRKGDGDGGYGWEVIVYYVKNELEISIRTVVSDFANEPSKGLTSRFSWFSPLQNNVW